MTADEQAAALAKAMAALRAFNIEAFTLLAIALLVTFLRCWVRIRTVGFKNLWADDYLVLVAAVSFSVSPCCHGISTDSILGCLLSRNRPSILSGKHCSWSGQQLHDSSGASGSRSQQPGILDEASLYRSSLLSLRNPILTAEVECSAARSNWPAGQPTRSSYGCSRHACAPSTTA
jgi:hypothetical protein